MLQPERVGTALQLQANTDVSLAFSIWVQLRQANIQSSAELKTIWKAVLDSCIPDTIWEDCGLIQPSLLSEFVNLSPTYSMRSDQFCTPDSNLPDDIAPVAKACLWLPKLLLRHCNKPASTTVQQYISDIHDSAEQGSTLHFFKGTAGAHKPQLLKLMRGLLLLKLIDVLASIKYEAAGIHDLEDILWQLLSDMLICNQPEATHGVTPQEQVILYPLLQMLVSKAKLLIAQKATRDVLHATMVLRILRALIPGRNNRRRFCAKMLKQGRHRLQNSSQSWCSELPVGHTWTLQDARHLPCELP